MRMEQSSKQARSDAGPMGLDRRDFLRLLGGTATAGFAGPLLAACGSTMGSNAAQHGQANYPTRPVNMVVPYGAGGGSDQLARTVAPFASKKLGVSIPVENDPGANGAVGLAKLAGSSPDGYTIATYIADNTASAAFGGTPWQPDQLVGICRLMDVPSFFFVNARSKYKGIDDVIRDAKSSAGKIRIATVGQRSVDEVTIKVVQQKAGVTFKLVPFSEPSDRYKSLLNGEVEVLYEQGGDVSQYINGGQFRPVVVFREEPFPAFSKVPTSKALGWPVYFPQYRGVVAPKGTPDDIRKTLFQAFKAWADSDSYSKFAKQQLMSQDSFQGPDFFQNEIQEDLATFKKYITEFNLG